MGITGLLPFLKDASTQINISELRNYTVAIDSYCWLHKGAFGCAEKLARGEDTNGYVLYCLKYIKMLQQHNIRPIMVFDGQHLPAKKATEEKRRKQRSECKKRAQELLRLGKASEAYSFIRRSIDITHKMALNLIKECRNMGIDCIVAPYEADSQLAWLNMSGICQAVVSEDSDLVLFGCTKIIYKLDLSGQATLVNAEGILSCMKMRPDNYSFDKFRHMCILSGCDYLESLPGVGIKKALKFVTMTANPSIYDVLPKLPSYLKLKEIEVTDDYRKQFMIADATFQHQIVYDPLLRKLTHLRDPEPAGTKKAFLANAGNFYDDNLAFKMALGNIDPFSLKEVDTWTPTPANTNSKSIWSSNYKKSYSFSQSSIAVASVSKFSAVKVRKENDADVEIRKINEDVELNEELSVYLKNEPVKRKREVDEEEKREEAQSPILKKEIFNPFKKISKFQRTQVTSSEVKISKYFLRNTKSESAITVEKTEEFQTLQEIEINKMHEMPVSPKKDVIEILEDENSPVSTSNDHKQAESLKLEPIVLLSKSERITSTQKTLLRSKSTSKITKKELPKNQKTLLSMFSFTKPSQV